MIYNIKNGFPEVFDNIHYYWIRYGTADNMTPPFVCAMYKKANEVNIMFYGDYLPTVFSNHPTISELIKRPEIDIFISDPIENPF